jgi:hypothetical protein
MIFYELISYQFLVNDCSPELVYVVEGRKREGKNM